jgi:hypothetical protein
MNKVIISTRLSLEDFVNVNYVLFFQKAIIKYIFFLAIVFIVAPFAFYASGTAQDISWAQPIIGLAFPTILLVSINLSARKNYNSNKRISEPVTYEFGDVSLKITAETSNANIPWDQLYKVTQTKNWLLIWQSAQLANCIPKRDTTVADLAIIKSIVQQNKVKNNLK